MIELGTQRRADLIDELEETAAMLREFAACRIILPKAREKLNSAADLFEIRAQNFRAAISR